MLHLWVREPKCALQSDNLHDKKVRTKAATERIRKNQKEKKNKK